MVKAALGPLRLGGGCSALGPTALSPQHGGVRAPQGTPRTAQELLGACCWQMKSRHTRGLHKLSQSPCREATSFSQQTLRSPELLAKSSGRPQW